MMNYGRSCKEYYIDQAARNVEKKYYDALGRQLSEGYGVAAGKFKIIKAGKKHFEGKTIEDIKREY